MMFGIVIRPFGPYRMAVIGYHRALGAGDVRPGIGRILARKV